MTEDGRDMEAAAGDAPETARAISALPRAVGLRNVLIHGYATVDDRIVWWVVEANLPALREEICALLG